MVLGKRVLVLGGGGAGIGRAIVRRLGDAGAVVVVADLQQDRAEEAAAELVQRGAAAWPVWGDVRSASELEAMIGSAVDLLGGLDGLVIVVGGQVAFVPAVKLHVMADEDWDTVYEVNFRYVAREVRQVLRRLLEQSEDGAIVSVGSVTGFMAAPLQASYGVAKAEAAETQHTGSPTEKLLEAAARSMPAMVMQKFHNVTGGEVPHRFYEMTGTGKGRIVRLTPELQRIAGSEQLASLTEEVDARWGRVPPAV
jgi:NADP-dependent 3-hydroxy acid dehydrogenase YdfG